MTPIEAVMTSILNLQPHPLPEAVEEEPGLEPAAEYELVLGRAQVASWLFVGVIAVAVCGALAYLAGETGARAMARVGSGGGSRGGGAAASILAAEDRAFGESGRSAKNHQAAGGRSGNRQGLFAGRGA